jgi:hypothetical protein
MEKKLKCTILTLLMFSVSVLLYGQVVKTDIDKAIDFSTLKHPYLYFSEKDKAELLSRIKNEPDCNDIFRKLEAQAKMWLEMPVDRDIPVQGKNTRAGWSEQDNDGKYSKYYSTNLNNAFYLAFLYQMTGELKYAEKAFEFADAFCDLTTWTQRAHEFPIIYSRIMPWNVPDDQVNFNFDHYNGDAGRLMAAVYDWLYTGLTPAQRDRIRGALIEKVVTRVRGDYEFHWWATAYRCNWCGVCNSGIGLTGLALLTENPQLTDIVAESYNRINSMLNELGVDGGWQEGGGYWEYGVHTSMFFADALKRITGSKFNLFENEKLKNNPATFPLYISLPGRKSINFEDSGGGSLIGSAHMINKLASETGNPEAAWYSSEFLSQRSDVFDIIWPKPVIKPEQPKIASKHFRTIDWWVMRSDFKDPSKVVVAGKAGMNNDPHHGHLDIGSFVLYWQNDYFLQDKGKEGVYDEKFFDDARWEYPHASSIGHNVIFVNGEKQIPGKMRKQPWNFEVGGKVLEFRTSDKSDYVLMDPSNAYPKIELKGWRRHVVFDKPEITLVLDEISANPGASVEIRFHPGVGFETKDKFAVLGNDKGKMALIPVAMQEFDIIKGRHAAQYINATKAFFWIDYFDTELKTKDKKTTVATIILPVTDADEAGGIASSGQMKLDKSGNLLISFMRKGTVYSYEFKSSVDGFRLKK